jgi:hypothetical protein
MKKVADSTSKSQSDLGPWKEIERNILEALDIAAEYAAMGVKFVNDRATDKGWLKCHAITRDDNNPSAAVFVGHGPKRGRWCDLGGEPSSLSFWNFAARFGNHGDWREARKFYAEKTKIALPGGGEPKRPEEAIDFLGTQDTIIAAWCITKGGFDLDAVIDNGGTNGRYPKKAKVEQSQFVVAFPGFNGPAFADGEPDAWVICNQTGEPVRLWRGKTKPPSLQKTLSVGGSVGSLLGKFGLKHIETAEIVWKVEGLSDLLALCTAITNAGLRGKHVVISNSQGTIESVHDDWVELLTGKTVYVIHDSDRPGRIGCNRWCIALAGNAKELRPVILPYEVKDSHGEDVRDFLHRDKHPYADLLAFAEQSPVITTDHAVDLAKVVQFLAIEEDLPRPGELALLKASASANSSESSNNPQNELPAANALAGGMPSSTHESKASKDAHIEDILSLLQIEVLGEYPEEDKIEVYSRCRRKVCKIKCLDRFSHRALVRMIGDPALTHVHDGRDTVQGKISIEAVRIAIAYKAGLVDLSENRTLGQGIWLTDDGLVLVNGSQAALCKNGVLTDLNQPRLAGQILDFSASKPWIDFAKLRNYLSSPDLNWSKSALSQLAGILASWNWKHCEDARVATALVVATFVQTVWPWRPEVAITGASDCGKTTLMTALKAVFGGLAFHTEKASEAGLRQHVRNRACAIMIDEFESDGHRQKILELFRTSSTGGQIVRGTADQKGIKFGLKHIPWVAAIESGLHATADRNRFIVLDLNTLAKNVRGKLRLPSNEALTELGVQLCAIGLRFYARAVEIFRFLKEQPIEGVHGRVIESYAVPAAIWAAVEELDDAGATSLLKAFVEKRDHEFPTDEIQLAADILGATVDAGHGKRYSAAHILTDEFTYVEASRRLEQCGVGFPGKQAGEKGVRVMDSKVVLLKPDLIKRYLLKDTRWAELNIDQLLMRLDPKAERGKHRLDGRSMNVIRMPRAALGLDMPGAVAETPQTQVNEEINEKSPLMPDRTEDDAASGDSQSDVSIEAENTTKWEQPYLGVFYDPNRSGISL